MKKVLITGILGQDGSNMAEHLLRLDQDLEIYGAMRRLSNPNFSNIESFKNHPRFHLEYMDLSDDVSVNNCFSKLMPDYLFNFGANSFVGVSWDMPTLMFNVNTLGVVRCLEAIKNFKPECRFYSAGSSEEFGDVEYTPQDLEHPPKPRSPYGASKVAARAVVKVYRESYGMYAVHGTLFNHEGIRRGEEFVTRKITMGAAQAHDNESPQPIYLGNVDAKRDWSDSEDFVKAVWLMLQKEKPQDYLLASGEAHTVREFVEIAYRHAGFENAEWRGEGLDESFGYEKTGNWVPLVKISKDFYRPAEVNILLGDSSKTRLDLDWQPKVTFKELVAKMVKWDIEKAKEKKAIPA